MPGTFQYFGHVFIELAPIVLAEWGWRFFFLGVDAIGSRYWDGQGKDLLAMKRRWLAPFSRPRVQSI